MFISLRVKFDKGFWYSVDIEKYAFLLLSSIYVIFKVQFDIALEVWFSIYLSRICLPNYKLQNEMKARTIKG